MKLDAKEIDVHSTRSFLSELLVSQLNHIIHDDSQSEE